MYNLHIFFTYKDLGNLENILNICNQKIAKIFWKKYSKIENFDLKRIINLAFREKFNLETPDFNTCIYNWFEIENWFDILTNYRFWKKYFYIRFYFSNLEENFWNNFKNSENLENIFKKIATEIWKEVNFEAFACLNELEIDPIYWLTTEISELKSKEMFEFLTFAYFKNNSWNLEFLEWKCDIEWIKRKKIFKK